MDKRDITIKYKSSIDENRIENIWNDIYSVNRVVRYGKSVGEIVDMICMNVVKMMELDNQFRTIKYDLDKIQNTNKQIRLSGVETLKNSNRLGDYIETLDNEERQLMTSLDLGISDMVSEVKLREFKNRQNTHSNNYSMTNG